MDKRVYARAVEGKRANVGTGGVGAVRASTNKGWPSSLQELRKMNARGKILGIKYAFDLIRFGTSESFEMNH